MILNEIYIGQEVIVKYNLRTPVCNLFEKKGIIVHIGNGLSGGIDNVCIEFYEDIGGHDGNQIGEVFGKDGHCWYLPAEMVAPTGKNKCRKLYNNPGFREWYKQYIKKEDIVCQW